MSTLFTEAMADELETTIEHEIEQLKAATAQQPTPKNIKLQTSMQNEYALYHDRKKRLKNEQASKYKDEQQEQETMDALVLLDHSLGQLSRLYRECQTHRAPVGVTQ